MGVESIDQSLVFSNEGVAWSVVVKKDLSLTAKLWIYSSVFMPNLSCGLEVWTMTKRTRSWIKVDEMSFLHRMVVFGLRDRVRSLE